MATRVALIGPGAIGGTIAAHLGAQSEIALHLVVRTPFAELSLLTPDGETIRTAPAFLTDSDAPDPLEFDWVLVATKAYHVPAIAPWLQRLVGPQTRVAILQNGVEHRERFAGLVSPDQVLPVMVDIPAERMAPGKFHQRAWGLLRVPDDRLGHAFVELFTHTPIDAATATDFTTVLWRKLTLNAPGALNALLLQPNRIVQQMDIADLMRAMMIETLTVARAEGADLPDSLPDEILESMRQASPDGVNSLQADRAAGRPLEVDARNGAVVRAGLRHGIPTPLNQMALTLLQALDTTPK